MAHGHPLAAFGAHLMGPLLFLMVLAAGLYSPYAIVRGRPIRVLYDARPVLPALIATAAAGLLAFALRLAHVMPPR
jgi:hypothetical protein